MRTEKALTFVIINLQEFIKEFGNIDSFFVLVITFLIGKFG